MPHRQVPAVSDCGREAQGQGGPSVCRSKAGLQWPKEGQR